MMPPNQMPPAGANAGAPQQQPSRLPPHLSKLPPEIAAQIDPNNPIQMELLKRIDTLSPQEAQALRTGITPQAAAVMKRLLPEVGFLLSGRGAGAAPGGQAPQQGAPGGQPPRPPMPPQGGGGGAPPPQAQGGFPPRPKSRLGEM